MALTVAELRSVFTADTSDLKRGDREAQAAARGTAGAYESAGRRINTSTQRSSGFLKTMRTHLGLLGVTGGVFGLGALIKQSSQLEQAYGKTMNLVQASTGASGREIAKLDALAMKLGADTQFSANDAAGAMLELAKAGIKTNDIYGGALKGTLLLAAAGGTDLGTAATIASNAMNTFNLKGRDMAKIAAALAGGANASSASIESLGQGLQQVGPGAKNAGLNLQQTVAVLSAFDAAGVKGSDAGTSLKTMLMNLVPQTKQAKDAMKALGLDFVDAHGNFVDITNVAQQLKDKLGPLSEAQRTQALTTIFGSDASRAATILMNQGAKGLDKYIAATKDQTAAQKMADASMKGTAGSMERLRGSVETAELALGKALAPTIRDVADWLSKKGTPAVTHFIDGMRKGTGVGGKLADDIHRVGDAGKNLIGLGKHLFDMFSDLPGPARQFAAELVIAAAAASKIKGLVGIGGSLTGGVAKSAVGGIVRGSRPVPVIVTNPGFGSLAGGKPGGVAGGAAGLRTLRVATVAIEAGTAIIGAKLGSSIVDWITSRGKQPPETKPIFNQFEQQRTGITRLLTGQGGSIRGAARDTLNTTSGFGKISHIGDKVVGAITRQDVPVDAQIKKIKQLDTAIAALASKDKAQGISAYNEALKKSGLSADQLNKILPKTAKLMKPDPKETSEPVLRSMLAMQGMGKAQIDAAVAAQKGAAAQSKYAKVLNTIPKDIRSYISTPGAPMSMDIMRRIAKQYNLTPKQIRTVMQIQGFTETQGRIVAAGKSFDRLPKQVKTALRADTVKSQSDVKALQKRYGLTPKQVQTVMHVSGVDAAIAKTRELQRAIAAIRSKSVTIDAVVRRRGSAGGVFAPSAHADGGTIAGQRAPYGDKVLTMLAPGEEVISNRRGQADKHRGLLKAINAGMLADGGTVGSTLEILEAQRSIRDLTHQLAERKSKMVGKGKHRHKVKAGYVAQGLDRQILAAELAEAKKDFTRLKGKPAPEDVDTSLVDQFREQLLGNIFTSGVTTAGQLLKNLTTMETGNAQWASMIAGLSKAGLSKGLLDQFKTQGPTAQALALGKSILATGNIGGLNTAQAGLGKQADQYAAFATGKAGSPVAAVHIENFNAQGQTPAEIGERFYFISQVRK